MPTKIAISLRERFAVKFPCTLTRSPTGQWTILHESPQVGRVAATAATRAEAIEKMPQTEKIVLNLYYHEELTLREIAKVVSLHESRVSQLKSQAILRLRSYIERRWPMKRGA